MAKTNWQDPQTSEIVSPDISGLQEAVKKIEESIDIDTLFEENIPLTEVFISNDDRCRIYQAPEGKRNWLSYPAPVIKKNGDVITNDFHINYGGGAVIFTTPIEETDVLTADATYTINETDFNKSKEVTKSPIGFPNRTESTFNFNKSTRTFTIEPTGDSYEVFFKGKKFIKDSPESVVIPNETGLYYIYFNQDGILSASTISPGLQNMIYISYVYWNADQSNPDLQFGVGDERHGTVMDKATHERLHAVDWTQWVSGLQLYGYTMGDSDNDDAVKVSITDGVVADEDLFHNISHSPTPSNFFEQVLQDFALLPVMYREGSNGEWKQDQATEYPFKNTSNSRLNFNEYEEIEEEWIQSEVPDGDFVAYYIAFTADSEQPIKVIQGQRTDNSLADAQANNDDRNIQWGNVPFQEFKVLYRLIFQTSDSFANERKAMLVDVLDLRAARRSPGGGGIIPSAHSNLTGLDYESSGHTGFASQEALNAHKADNAVPLPKPSGGDDAAAIQEVVDIAVATGRGICSPSDYNYKIYSTVNLRYVKSIDIRGTITQYFDGVGVILGHASSSSSYTENFINCVYKNGLAPFTAPADPTIKIIGLKNANVRINYAPYIQIYADTDDATTGSVAYNNFYINMCEYIHCTANPDTEGSTTQWINQNIFWGGRIGKIKIEGTYGHNCNIFIAPTLENTNTEIVNISRGHSNAILMARLEGSGNTIYFGEHTHNNIITQLWCSEARAAINNVSPTVIDLGTGNTYIREQLMYRDEVSLLTINKNTRIFGTTSENGISNINPGLEKVSTTSWATIWDSDFIPVINGTAFEFKSDALNWRPRFFIYDENKQLITGDDPNYASGAGMTWNSGGYYTFGSNIESGICTIINSTVAYVKIRLATGNSTTPFNYFVLLGHFMKWREKLAKTLIDNGTPLVLATAPTNGFAKLGQIIAKTAGGVFVCTKSIDQTLSATAASGATSVSVTDATGIEDGDIVGILLDDGKTDWRVVAGLSGTTFNVAALSGQASEGNRIVFNKWV